MDLRRRWERFSKGVKEAIQDESGLSSVEYAIMIALILGACAVTVNVLANSLRGNFDRSAKSINDAI